MNKNKLHVNIIFHSFWKYKRNKNAFQQDAYRPLVARISQHALLRGGEPGLGGVPGQGVYLAQGCTWSWGVYLV